MGSFRDTPSETMIERCRALSWWIWLGGFALPWCILFFFCCLECIADVVISEQTLSLRAIFLFGLVLSSVGIIISEEGITEKIVLIILNVFAMFACFIPFVVLIVLVFGFHGP